MLSPIKLSWAKCTVVKIHQLVITEKKIQLIPCNEGIFQESICLVKRKRQGNFITLTISAIN